MITIAINLVACTLIAWIIYHFRQKTRPLPPGPAGEFILGNARQMRPFHSWLYYADLAKQYGDVVYLNVVGQPVIALNTLQAVEDLIVKKSALFSGRPQFPMVYDLVNWKYGVALLSLGPRFTAYRKLHHQWFGPLAVAQWDVYFEAEIRNCIARAVLQEHRRGDFLSEFKFSMARMTLDKTYGINPDGPDNKFVTTSQEATIALGEAIQPGRFLVDSFPFLKYVPSWVPFAGFQKLAKKWRTQVWVGVGAPFEHVKSEMAAGVENTSFVAQSLKKPPAGVNEEYVKWAAGSLYAAAVDTTTATISVFILNMILHPEMQAKGRAEVLRVVGTERLPSLADRPNLPYIDCILKEVLRWHPIAPMGVPYRSTEDFTYRGWFIPKNSILLANIWNITRDTEVYPNPEEFIPERFENDIVARTYFFGFGRRICPGQYFADAVLWITIATLLATVTMSKAVDDEGCQITPTGEFSGGSICAPLPFPFRVRPVSDAGLSLLEASDQQ